MFIKCASAGQSDADRADGPIFSDCDLKVQPVAPSRTPSPTRRTQSAVKLSQIGESVTIQLRIGPGFGFISN
jgi:hypothetical protein